MKINDTLHPKGPKMSQVQTYIHIYMCLCIDINKHTHIDTILCVYAHKHRYNVYICTSMCILPFFRRLSSQRQQNEWLFLLIILLTDCLQIPPIHFAKDHH